MHTIILAALAAVATAMPSYIAVPADQIAFLDLRELSVRRVPRQTLTPPPQTYEQHYQPVPLYHQTVALSPPPAPELPARLTQVQPDSAPAATVGARAPDFGEYVDFGAHTGDHGAFGWYADYPVNNHDTSGY